MELSLERPLLFFDIESTGLNIASDSIIELSLVKIYGPSGYEGAYVPASAQVTPLEDGSGLAMTWRVKPWDYEKNCQRPISPGAMSVHGIKDEELTACHTFYEIADDVLKVMDNCDLAGFNSSKFDLPMLAEELERVRKYKGKAVTVDLHAVKMVDVQNIYHQLEPRNLKAAYRFYCDKDLEKAHSAEADTVATYEVLKAQLDRYPVQLKNDVEYLSNFSERQKIVDYAGRLVYNDKKEVIINFGKHKGKTAREVYESEPSYFTWIENGEFTLDTKQQFIRLRREFEQEKVQARNESLRKLTDTELAKSVSSLADKFGSGRLF